MGVHKVLRMGDPRLLRVAEAVTEFNTPALDALVRDMFDTMDSLNGAGLAAPQIGINRRLVIFGFEANPRYPEVEAIPISVLINPVLEFLGPEMDEDWEGCLSVPGMRGLVPRYTRLRYSGFDQRGERFVREVHGFHAREVPLGPTLEMVRGHVQQYIGTDVRWGGSIVKVENRPAETVLEIVARPLQDYGRPAEVGESSGRFLARYSGFLDPMIYTKGRSVTVVGKIAGEEQRPIDKYTYGFPVVAIENYYLWEPLPSMPAYQPPYFYDPWWPYPPSWRYRRHPYWW